MKSTNGLKRLKPSKWWTDMNSEYEKSYARLWQTLQSHENHDFLYQWIGLRENLQENPIFNGKIYGFL